MAESGPDELYTLRAQYQLGHYALALAEARQVARRPMPAALKQEREEYQMRAHAALQQYDKCVAQSGDGPGLQALALKAQYEAAVGDPKQQSALLDQLKSLVAGCASSAALLAAAQVCLAADEIPAAYQFVVAAAAAGGGGSSGGSVEGTACKIQILLKLDRPDLAQAELLTLQRVAEESILADLCAVYVLLYGGGSATAAADAEHTLTALVEQYGPSVYLTNLLAVALAARGEYAAAEAKLTDCLREFADMPPPQRHETQVNLVTVLTQQGKMADAAAVVEQIVGASSGTSSCSLHFAANLDRVTVAFDREAAKYKV